MIKCFVRIIIYAIVVQYIGMGAAQSKTDVPMSTPLETSAAPTTWGLINDTGIKACANAQRKVQCPVKGYPNQDAQFGQDVIYDEYSNGHAGFNFSKISSTGDLLSPFAISWDCVKDNVTGLFWEVKTDDGGLHDKDWTYSWYETNTGNNGSNVDVKASGFCGKTSVCDTAGFVKAVNTEGWCGYKDWRLPTVDELAGIASLDRVDVAIDGNFFSETQSGYYWTSLPYASGNASAWSVSFSDGHGAANVKSNTLYVRLVRGE